jgi:hypothetical protein
MGAQMETKMVVRCHEVEVDHFFLNWSTPDLAAYADKFGVPPQKIFVAVKGTATQLSAYGRLDLTTGEVVDNTNHQTLYMLWHLFAKGEAVSPEVEMSLEEFEKLVAYSRDFSEARLIDAEIDSICEEKFCHLMYLPRIEKIRDSAPTLAQKAIDKIEKKSAESTAASIAEKEKREKEIAELGSEYREKKQRIEKFLREGLLEEEGASEIANQFRDGLLAEDDLRKYARIIFFAPMEEFARYKSLEKDECPECTDSCYQRSVSFYAENAESLPVDLYPIHTAFVAKVRGLLPQARCTLRYHQVTCENCEGEVFPKYAVLVSINWEGLTISREYDPFSTQQ